MPSRLFRGGVVGTAAFLTLVLAAWSTAQAEALVLEELPKDLHRLPLVFREDFESANSNHWLMSDPKAWQVLPHRKNHVLCLTKQSLVKTSIVSPANRALIKDLYLSDCVIDVRMQATNRDFHNRDLCVFLGYQDPKHYYYVHLSKKADKESNQIFIVEDANRAVIEGSETMTSGTNWDDSWHHVRVVRKLNEGLILVYFDDMDKPTMKAIDKTYKWGQVGVGSFDHKGEFDNVFIYGIKELPPIDRRVVVP